MSVEELRGNSASLTSSAILFLPEDDSSGRPITSLVREIRARHPGLHITVCTSDLAGICWPELARAGADDVTVIGGEHNARGLGLWVDERRTLPIPEDGISELLEQRGCGLAATMAAWCFRNSIRPRPVNAIARWFGISERTVRRRLDGAKFPQPDKLLRCGRILHSVALERAGVRPKSRIAELLGYATAQDLRRAKATLRADVEADSLLASLVNDVRKLWFAVKQVADA
jgi:hypothetical protein